MDKEEFEALGKLFAKKKILLDTTELVHSEAYVEAVKAHLTDDNGDVDYDKLNDNATQLAFADTMRKKYLTEATNRYGVKGKLDKLKEEMLIKAYIGVTSDVFRSNLKELRSGYTLGQHNAQIQQLKQSQDRELNGIIYGDISREHIAPLLKHMGAANYADANKMELGDLTSLLSKYHTAGSISEKDVKGTHYHKKAGH